MIDKEAVEGVKAFAEAHAAKQDAGVSDNPPASIEQPPLSKLLARTLGVALTPAQALALKQMVWSLNAAARMSFTDNETKEHWFAVAREGRTVIEELSNGNKPN